MFLIYLLLLAFSKASSDYYAVLGIPEDADDKEIQKAFRKLSKYHPDRNPGDKEIHAKYIEITKAYEVLSNPDRRQIYDIYGEMGVNDSERFNKKRGNTSRFNIEVDLADVYSGATKEITVKRNEICKKCKGTGAKDKRIALCSVCGGRGTRTTQPNGGMRIPCERCGMRGFFISEKCQACKGQKVTSGMKTFTVEVEPGMDSGSEIKFDGQGEQSPEWFPGDIIFSLRVKNHYRFERQGNDLITIVKLTLRESLLGYSKEITHLDGHIVKIEHEGITQPQSEKIIEDEGMPTREMHSHKGKLIVKFVVDYPEKLTDEQQNLIKQLLPAN